MSLVGSHRFLASTFFQLGFRFIILSIQYSDYTCKADSTELVHSVAFSPLFNVHPIVFKYSVRGARATGVQLCVQHDLRSDISDFGLAFTISVFYFELYVFHVLFGYSLFEMRCHSYALRMPIQTHSQPPGAHSVFPSLEETHTCFR